jgi:hypothetical protein
MRCTSCTPSPAPPNGEYLPKPVDPLLRVNEGIFGKDNLFLIQSTHHQPRVTSYPGTKRQVPTRCDS